VGGKGGRTQNALRQTKGEASYAQKRGSSAHNPISYRGRKREYGDIKEKLTTGGDKHGWGKGTGRVSPIWNPEDLGIGESLIVKSGMTR